MKIQFINVRYDETKFRFRVNTLWPPLGMAYLASIARQNGHEVSILDMEALHMDYDELFGYLAARRPDLIGVHGTTPTSRYIAQCVRIARECCPQATVILGGAHATLLPEQALREMPQLDYLLRGEAEHTFPQFLRLLASGCTDMSTIPGIGFHRENEELFISAEQPKTEDLDALPFPAWDLLPLHAYFGGKSQRHSMSVISSRGCPQGCIFCCESVINGRKYRGRSARNVVDEIEALWRRHNVDHINFYDASFMADRTRVIEICREMLSRELPVTFRARARADHIDDEIADLLKQAGCTELAIGVESGSQRLLDALNKNESIENMERAFRTLHKAGLWISAFFMFGAPGETREDSYQTIRFAQHLDPDWALFAHVTPLPGTRLYEMMQHQLITHDWYDFRLNANSPVLAYGGMSREEIQQIQLDAYRMFYVRKEWLLNRLRKAKTQSEIDQVVESFFYYLNATNAAQKSEKPSRVERKHASVLV